MEYDKNTRSAFKFFRSYRDTVAALPEPSDRLRLYNAIFDYMLDGTPPDFAQAEPLIKMAWAIISPHLKASRTRSENGCKGGAPKGSRNNPNGRPKRTNQELTEELTITNQELTEELTITNQRTKQREREREREREIKEKKLTQKKDRGDFATAARSLSDEVSYFSPRSRSEISPYNFGEGETYPDNETAAIDSEPKNGGEAVAEFSTALGVGEYLRPDGLRTYGKGKAIVPQDAPPRPRRGAAWDSTRQRWTHKGRAADE